MKKGRQNFYRAFIKSLNKASSQSQIEGQRAWEAGEIDRVGEGTPMAQEEGSEK